MRFLPATLLCGFLPGLLLVSGQARASDLHSGSVDTLSVIHAITADSTRTSAAEPDTIYYASEEAPLLLQMIRVAARRVSRQSGADRIELGRELIGSRSGGSVADLVGLLPSTKLTVNSRGESLFMVRGSGERHLRVELDGIPLTIPWDERTDLSMLPLLAVDTVEARRGVSSALEPPNTLAGILKLRTRRQVLDGSSTRLGSWIGEAGAWGVQALHQRADGPWNSLVALEHREREGFLLPEDAQSGMSQDRSRRLRLNSAMKQTSALARFGRESDNGGRWQLLVQASQGEKQVPPEEHLVDPRYWRYPKLRRLLLGGNFATGPGTKWKLDSSASFDLYEQNLESFTDRSYSVLEDREEDRDRTGFWRLRLGRNLGRSTALRVRTTARHSRHEESFASSVPATTTTQWLLGGAAEIEHRVAGAWDLRAGAGYETATTPETGDKPSRDGDHELVLQTSVEHELGEDGKWHLNASRRPRFPSLRELFSGALGTFEPNEDLRPEEQRAVETGLSWQGSRWNASANFFARQIDDAIERVTTPAGTRKRVNLDTVRDLGLELGGVVKPLRGLSFDVQGTWLHSRARDSSGDFTLRVEDRPDWLLTAAATVTHRSGFRLRAELDGTGPRSSLDVRSTDPGDPFTRLGTDLRLNLRLSWRHFGQVGGYFGSEWFLSVDNLTDRETFSQLGLAGSGRMVRAGMHIDFDR